jgi:hypothetical protein
MDLLAGVRDDEVIAGVDMLVVERVYEGDR